MLDFYTEMKGKERNGGEGSERCCSYTNNICMLTVGGLSFFRYYGTLRL